MQLLKNTNLIWSITDFWDNEYCDLFVEESEAAGYTPAKKDRSIDASDFSRTNSIMRSNSEKLANQIWEDIKKFVPNTIEGFEANGINSYFRFYKYSKGEYFQKHKDCSTIISTSEKSFFSLLIYLNENYTGGATLFDDTIIKPEKGKAVIFPHELSHSGQQITDGEKYILRSDIMYRKLIK
jgi:prolyl 4-hydroxylase